MNEKDSEDERGVNISLDFSETPCIIVDIYNKLRDVAWFGTTAVELDDEELKSMKGRLYQLYIEAEGDIIFEDVYYYNTVAAGKIIPEYTFTVDNRHDEQTKVPLENRSEKLEEYGEATLKYVDYSDCEISEYEVVEIHVEFICNELPEGYKRHYSRKVEVEDLIAEKMSEKI